MFQGMWCLLYRCYELVSATEGFLGGPRLLGGLMISLWSRGEHAITFQYKVLNLTN